MIRTGHWDLTGLTVTPIGTAMDAARFDLSLTLAERQDEAGPAGIGGALLYAADPFDPATARLIAVRYRYRGHGHRLGADHPGRPGGALAAVVQPRRDRFR